MNAAAGHALLAGSSLAASLLVADDVGNVVWRVSAKP